MTTHVKTRTKITPANPNLICAECREPVKHFDGGEGPPTNRPCGHHADYINTDPAWSPE